MSEEPGCKIVYMIVQRLVHVGGLNGRGCRLEKGRLDGWVSKRIRQRGWIGRLDVNWLLNVECMDCKSGLEVGSCRWFFNG